MIVFLFFTALILFFSLSGYTFLGIQDEVQLQATLSAGDPKNYMTSYPFAMAVGYLYTHFPQIPWYSVTMLLYIWLMALLMAFYIVLPEYPHRLFRYLLLIFFTLLLLYILLGVDITSITLLLLILAIPLIKKHQIYFWLLLWLASFLREELIISVLPLFVLAYALTVRKTSFSRRGLFLILFFALASLFNHSSYRLDSAYKEWMDFTKARLYFTDLTGLDEKKILSNDEYELAKTWWICDLDLYPAEKIPKAAGSTLEVAKQKIFNNDHFLRHLFAIPYHHPVIIFLALMTLYILYLEKSWIRRGYYLLFGIGFTMVLLVKDVERVTFPLLLLWWTLLVLALLRERRERALYLTLGILILFVGQQTYWGNLTAYQKNENLVKEFKGLIKKNPMELEISSGFTASWELLTTVLKQNHLLYEKNWVDYNQDLLLSGWFTMHPLCLKQHHISFKGVKRKYDRYYDWLLDSHTGIIGSKGEAKHIRPFLANNLLRMYDEKLAEPGCHHEVKVVDESEHFIIHQIVKICKQK